jgi:hypothetical protein
MKKLAATLLLVSAAVGAQDKPPIPFEDVGACPFECCTYREWETTAPVVFYKERSEKSAVSYQAKAKEKVVGVTGVVVTRKYGVTKIIAPISLGSNNELSLKPGDLLYTLRYAGEGYDIFWYKGKTYSDQISDDSLSYAWKIQSRPKYDWWVQVRNKGNIVGWTKNTRVFAHMDACE